MQVLTTTTRTVTPHRRLLFTHKPWIYYNFSGSNLFSTTLKPIPKAPVSPSGLSSILNVTVPLATPWYSPADPFDWWQWQWYTTKRRKLLSKIFSTTTTTTTTTTRKTTTTTGTSKVTNRLTNSTSTVPSTTKSKATSSVFKWLDQTTSSKKKVFTDGFDEEYKDWIEYFTTIQNQKTSTSTKTTTSTLTSTSSLQKHQPLAYFSTKSNAKTVTINTPPAKRQHPQQNPVVNERNAVAIPTNGKSKQKEDLPD